MIIIQKHLEAYGNIGKPAVNNDEIVEFNGANSTDLFNFKAKIACLTDNNG